MIDSARCASDAGTYATMPRPEDLDSDAKSLRQRLIGIAEQLYVVDRNLAGTADRFWGHVPAEVQNSVDPPTNENSLRGIHAVVDELYTHLSNITATAQRFERLA